MSGCRFKSTRWIVSTLLAGALLTGLMDQSQGQNQGATNQPAPASSPSRVPAAIFPPSPISQFRGLLSMDPVSREKILEARNPAQIEVLRRKITEYQAMPRQEVELRLRQLELCRWMLPMMPLEQEARQEHLTVIPPRDRMVVEERLKEWDRLAPAQKENVLKDKTVLSYFFRPEPAFIKRQMDVMSIMPPGLKDKLELELAQWKSRSMAEREKMKSGLTELLTLKQSEREKILTSIISPEKAQLRSTLGLFLKLTPEQRDNCIKGFSKLANLPAAEREQFILDTVRWQAMSPHQKNLWRTMVMRLHAPAPPPPTPLGAAKSSSTPRLNSLATNQ